MVRIEAGRVQAAALPLSISDIIDKVIADTHGIAHQKRLRLNFHIDDEVPDCIIGDEVLIYRVLVNLVSNAVKFTPKGSVMLRINLSNDKQSWVARVSDTGIGVPPEAREYIFEPFRQADSSSRRQYGGIGLGLAICRRFVAEMGGTILLEETEVGNGSTFAVSWPLIQQAIEAESL